MAGVTEEQILDALKTIVDPERRGSIVDLEMVSGLVIRDGNVGFAIEVDPEQAGTYEPLRKAAEQEVAKVPGVLSVTAVLTAHRGGGNGSAAAAPRSQGPAPAAAEASAKPLVPGIESIVAVASGKGGVGKSTTTTNLALAFATRGLRVGVLDADIYGPSQPRMLGIAGRPQSPDGQTLTPMENYGVSCMSMGFLVPEDSPMIWRGPMVQSALQQMLRDVEWGELDVLVVDMPPGTGDAQLTMAQRVALAGAVIVSTPQDLALIDARKGIAMFNKVNVPVLGIVENMSYFTCPHCGERSDIFGHGGAEATARTLGCDFLGGVPLTMAVRETSDAGTPIVETDPTGAAAGAYLDIAAQVAAKLDHGTQIKPAPRIVVE